MRITDEVLSAYVDGELEETERARVDAAARTDAALARRIQAQRRVRESMSGVFANLLSEPAPDRLLDAIQKPSGAATVVDLSQVRQQRAAQAAGQRRPNRWIGWAVAACAVVVIGASFVYAPHMIGTANAPMTSGAPGALTAQGALASALDNQLASAGVKPGDAVRIGVSFQSHEGRYCRTFQVVAGHGFSGLACREQSGWRIGTLVDTPSQPSGPTYRQAASETPPAVLASVDGLIEGAPFDAAQEAAAKNKGWTK